MRKRLYIAALLLAMTGTAATAQVESPRSSLEVGVAGGMNLSRMETQPSIRQGLRHGINGGISARYTSEKYFSMICATQLEVNFSQRGMIEDFDDGTSNYYSRLANYVEIPLFAHLSWGKEQNGFQFFLNLFVSIFYGGMILLSNIFGNIGKRSICIFTTQIHKYLSW